LALRHQPCALALVSRCALASRFCLLVLAWRNGTRLGLRRLPLAVALTRHFGPCLVRWHWPRTLVLALNFGTCPTLGRLSRSLALALRLGALAFGLCLGACLALWRLSRALVLALSLGACLALWRLPCIWRLPWARWRLPRAWALALRFGACLELRCWPRTLALAVHLAFASHFGARLACGVYLELWCLS
jgi:hypothetical protein